MRKSEKEQLQRIRENRRKAKARYHQNLQESGYQRKEIWTTLEAGELRTLVRRAEEEKKQEKPESKNLNREPEKEAEAKPEPKKEPELDPKPEAKPEPKPKLDPKPEVESRPRIGVYRLPETVGKPNEEKKGGEPSEAAGN